jgi:hypothetical protein
LHFLHFENMPILMHTLISETGYNHTTIVVLIMISTRYRIATIKGTQSPVLAMSSKVNIAAGESQKCVVG